MIGSIIALFQNIELKGKVTLDPESLKLNFEQSEIKRQAFKQFVEKWQNDFVQMIQAYEKKSTFLKDSWERKDKKGHGLSCILENGELIEKGGCNTTQIEMPFSKNLAMALLERGKKYTEEQIKNFKVYANGCSIVIHPFNPMAPTTHANFRYFELIDKSTEKVVECWFGGGVDLTPYYIFEEDCVAFHQAQRDACEKYQSTEFHNQLKKACDSYFYLKHRKEHRGIGGTFFNDIILDGDWQKTFEYVQTAAQNYLKTYQGILDRRLWMKFDEKNKKWQHVRRGRYVEYNLLYDAGTKFGLNTPNARIESIFMSLPPVVHYNYCFEPEKGSEEEKTIQTLMNPREWV